MRKLAYFTMIISLALPFILLLISLVFAMIEPMVFGHSIFFGYIVFGMMIFIAPITFLTFIPGTLISFVIGLITKSRQLLLVSGIPIIATIYIFWEALHQTKYSNGLIYNAMSVFSATIPSWLFAGYAGFVYILAGMYFYKNTPKRSNSFKIYSRIISISLALTAICMAIAILVLLIVEANHRLPINHVGYQPLLLLPVAVMSNVLAIIWFRMRAPSSNSKWHLAVFGLTILSLVVVVVIDRCNILVEYETWIQRGMPSAGQCLLIAK